jgi:replicative DNA helicase
MTATVIRDTDRMVPPHDLDAEQATLGGMLLSRSVISDVMEIVTPEMFYNHTHATIFKAIVALHETNKPADALTVAHHLDVTDLVRIGGAPYLHTLIESVPTVGNATHYARIVADYASLRDLDEACSKVRRMIHARAGSPGELVETARELVVELAGRAAATDGPTVWGDLFTDGFQRYEDRKQAGPQAMGIPTGFPDLDKVIKGIHTGRVYVVAGESGSGKSIFVGDLVRSATFHHGAAALVFNLEMTKPELFDRLLCAEAGVHHDHAVSGNLTDQDWAKLAKTTTATAEARLWLDDTARLTVADIRARVLRYKREQNVKIVVVDLIGLVTADRRLPREQQVAEISRKLQQLSVELDIAVIVVAQINRQNQQRADKRPSIHDLRESAQIGHDAAVVVLVHRPEKHDRSKRPGEADLIIDKNRFGPEQDITVCAQLHYCRFASFATPDRKEAL